MKFSQLKKRGIKNPETGKTIYPHYFNSTVTALVNARYGKNTLRTTSLSAYTGDKPAKGGYTSKIKTMACTVLGYGIEEIVFPTSAQKDTPEYWMAAAKACEEMAGIPLCRDRLFELLKTAHSYIQDLQNENYEDESVGLFKDNTLEALSNDLDLIFSK